MYCGTDVMTANAYAPTNIGRTYVAKKCSACAQAHDRHIQAWTYRQWVVERMGAFDGDHEQHVAADRERKLLKYVHMTAHEYACMPLPCGQPHDAAE